MFSSLVPSVDFRSGAHLWYNAGKPREPKQSERKIDTFSVARVLDSYSLTANGSSGGRCVRDFHPKGGVNGTEQVRDLKLSECQL